MASRDDSEDQFTLHTNYSPPDTCDLETQQLIAKLAAEDEIADLRADGANAGKNQANKRKLISLVDSEDESDVQITPPTQTSKPRRQTTFGTATRKPMLQSTMGGGSGSSARACSQKNVPIKAVIRGGRRSPPIKARLSTQSQKKKNKLQEDIPEFDDDLEEVELDEAENDLQDMENRQRSDVWTDFKVVEKHSGDLKAVCNHCKNEYAWYSHSHGISGLRRHRLRCKMYPRNGGRQQQLNTEGKVVSKKYDHTVFRQLVAKTIVQHDLPYSYVEHERVRETWKYLNIDVQYICRNTAKSDVYRMYESERDTLKRELASLPGRVSFTSDLWTSVKRERYMCLTAHYIDRNWKLNSKIMSFSALPPPHNSMSVKYVLASQSREELFEKCVNAAGITDNAGLILDVSTRWYSTYYMLERALKYHKAFVKLETFDKRGYKVAPTAEEWSRAHNISKFLCPFAEITALMSGSNYPTSNLYFYQVWSIHEWLQVNEYSEDEIVRKMVPPMKENFDKYWDEVSCLFAMAAVFDPRFKLSIVECCLGQLDMSTRDAKIKNLREKLSILFESYDKKSKANSPSTELRETVQQNANSAGSKGLFGNYHAFIAFRKVSGAAIGKTALEVYLDEPPLDFDSLESLDILHFWKTNTHRYGDLAAMACDLLSIPITTVALESSFSIGSRVLNKYRSRLLLKNVQALICTRNWIKGYEAYENDDETDPKIEEDTLPSFDSIVNVEEAEPA